MTGWSLWTQNLFTTVLIQEKYPRAIETSFTMWMISRFDITWLSPLSCFSSSAARVVPGFFGCAGFLGARCPASLGREEEEEEEQLSRCDPHAASVRWIYSVPGMLRASAAAPRWTVHHERHIRSECHYVRSAGALILCALTRSWHQSSICLSGLRAERWTAVLQGRSADSKPSS